MKGEKLTSYKADVDTDAAFEKDTQVIKSYTIGEGEDAERKEVKRQLKLLKKELIKANKQLAKQEKNSRSLQLKRNKQ